jgi:hypothetical protein
MIVVVVVVGWSGGVGWLVLGWFYFMMRQATTRTNGKHDK